MATNSQWKINQNDLTILRDLAKKISDIANSPINQERRESWYKHNSLESSRPLVLIESGIALNELVTESDLKCQEGWARGLELGFRRTIYHFENIKDDEVVEPYINCNWHVSVSNYGCEAVYERGDSGTELSSYRWDPPIKDLHKDFDKLHPRTYSVNREATLAWKSHLEEVFDGILGVRIRGGFWWTVGMTWPAVTLIGLDKLMLYMYDDPEGLHQLMAFLRDDHIAFAEWLEKEGLLSLNNENDYIGSGSRGYCKELPKSDWKNGDPVRLKDLWVLSESQETVGVGPNLFEEFIFPYQLAVIEKFGLCYYGCCEPVHSRWNVLKKIPNLRSVSISPWCDEEYMAEQLGRNYVYSRKPNPTLISTKRFDEELIRNDIRTTLKIAKNCNVEIIMKDVHTLSGEPNRMAKWVQIVREVIDEM
ncbi:TPA: hypothetical protein ENX78_03150 [Candidatus Poribacteria bacterium]|nr:hypothetical protein [Candidatus Poribacteria bacterium]